MSWYFIKSNLLKTTNNQLSIYIQNAKKGDQSAFNFLTDTFWSSVYNYQLKRIKNDTDAEDITIQTFSKAFDRIDTFDEKYQFKTWLITISKNIYIDFIRKKKLSVVTENDKDEIYSIADQNPTPEDIIITKQNSAKLLHNIKKLKPSYQRVIILRYFDELTYREIAEQMEESINNIKVKLLRSKKLLAEIMKKME